jgi:hypothetical protein
VRLWPALVRCIVSVYIGRNFVPVRLVVADHRGKNQNAFLASFHEAAKRVPCADACDVSCLWFLPSNQHDVAKASCHRLDYVDSFSGARSLAMAATAPLDIVRALRRWGEHAGSEAAQALISTAFCASVAAPIECANLPCSFVRCCAGSARAGWRNGLRRRRARGFLFWRSSPEPCAAIWVRWLAIETPWNNGPIEGQINRLKVIKRQSNPCSRRDAQ